MDTLPLEVLDKIYFKLSPLDVLNLLTAYPWLQCHNRYWRNITIHVKDIGLLQSVLGNCDTLDLDFDGFTGKLTQRVINTLRNVKNLTLRWPKRDECDSIIQRCGSHLEKLVLYAAWHTGTFSQLIHCPRLKELSMINGVLMSIPKSLTKLALQNTQAYLSMDNRYMEHVVLHDSFIRFNESSKVEKLEIKNRTLSNRLPGVVIELDLQTELDTMSLLRKYKDTLKRVTLYDNRQIELFVTEFRDNVLEEINLCECSMDFELFLFRHCRHLRWVNASAVKKPYFESRQIFEYAADPYFTTSKRLWCLHSVGAAFPVDRSSRRVKIECPYIHFDHLDIHARVFEMIFIYHRCEGSLFDLLCKCRKYLKRIAVGELGPVLRFIKKYPRNLLEEIVVLRYDVVQERIYPKRL